MKTLSSFMFKLKASRSVPQFPLSLLPFLRKICLFAFFTSFSTLQSQNWAPSFKHFTSNQGLSSNKITCITQDKFGFIWFGTEDGLTRYDGNKFVVYRNDIENEFSISNNHISSVTEDPKTGNLWIGTSNGLNFFNRKENRFYQDRLKFSGGENVLKNAHITTVMIDHKYQLWIGTFRGVIYCFKDDQSFPAIYWNDKKVISPEYSPNCLFEDSNNTIWVGTFSKLFFLDKVAGAFKPFPMPTDKIFVKAIYEDSKKTIWVSTKGQGVFQIKGRKVRVFSSENSGLAVNKVSGTVEDIHGNMLFAVADGDGLNFLDKKTDRIKVISPDVFNPRSLNTLALTCIFKDKDSNIWIGTFSSGVNFIDSHEKPFNHYFINHKQDGLLNNNIRSIFQDSDGDIWIGTRDGGGLSKFEPVAGTFENYKVSEAPYGLNDGYVLSITEAAPGKLLIGTLRKGFSIFDKKTRKFYPLKNHPRNDPDFNERPIYQLLTDRYGAVWVSSLDHTYLFDIRTNTFKRMFSRRLVRKMLDYNENELFFFDQSKGLWSYNRKTKRLFNYRLNNDNSLAAANLRISDMTVDSRKTLWLATDNGVCAFNPKTNSYRMYTVKDGLPASVIYGILVDNHDNIWISTTKGLAKFKPSSKRVCVYDIYDGLQGNEFEKQVCFKTASGFMIFGGQNGFNYFHPDSIRNNPIIPNVVITDFKLYNKSVRLNSKGSPLKQHISFTKELVLTYKQSVITFEFVAVNFTSPEKNKYAYILEGLENEWNYVGNKQSATYTSLRSGKYVFRVKACNNDGVWNESGASIHITVLPPWWKTWWFEFLVFAACIGFILNWIRSLQKQKQKLELMVKERTHQIEIQKDTLQNQKEQLEAQNCEIMTQRDSVLKLNHKIKRINESRIQFFTNVSHEFRTPLSLILGPVDKLLSQFAENKEIQRQLYLIKRNSNTLSGLVTELMDFRSIETQNMPLHLTKTDIVKFAGDIANCFVELAQQQKIDYSIHAENGSFTVCFDTAKLEKIIYNLISNAFKYTKSGGEIEITLGNKVSAKSKFSGKNHIVLGKEIPDCSYFEISVKDTGIGIETGNLHNVFKEFYRESSTGMSAISTGIGLALTQRLVLLHKGIIEVNSEKNQGSEFIVRIPTDEKHFENYILEPDIEYNIDYSKRQINNFLDLIPLDEYSEQDRRAYSNKKMHLLVIEDNIDMRNFIAGSFSETYRVSEAANGIEGLKKAFKYTPDLIISDVMMPEMNGIELCRQLKNDIRTSHIPVILLTALSDIASQVSGLETGADDYVLKPFDICILFSRAKNLIQSRNRLRQLFSTSTEADAKEITSNPQDEKFLQRALDIVYANFSDPNFGASEFVEKMYVSRSLMHRKLISLTNQSALDFITSIRLKESLKLISNPNLNILDISLRVGFNDSKYFSRCFKKHFGKNPSEYSAILQNITDE